MDEILSSQGDSTLMFAIDTTGSMSDEIHAAKAIAKQIINATRDFKVDYILSPFNDPRKFYENLLHRCKWLIRSLISIYLLKGSFLLKSLWKMNYFYFNSYLHFGCLLCKINTELYFTSPINQNFPNALSFLHS